MLKKLLLSIFASSIMLFAANIGDLSSVKTLKVDRDMTKIGKSCVECHAKETPGMVNDWKESRHGHVGISCIDCHQVKKDSPMATQACPGVKGTEVYISLLVTPKTCQRCHPNEVKEFEESGHARAGLQVHAKAGMQSLIHHFEGADNPHTKGSPEATGCMQCHGRVVELDSNKRPTPQTWPQAGMGTIYPDGSVGNCATCHTRHKFSIEEARKPAACASCHLGPDHPDIEIYNNSKHGHIFNAEGNKWKYDSAPDAWEPGDYRAPTCATCHMSGIGDLKTTHNISRRLKWNLWAPKSNLRDGGFDNAVKVWKEEGKFTKGNPVAGHPDGHKAARAEMEQVCKSCHSTLHTKNFFEMADKHVILYNESYYAPAKKMLDELKEKGLIEKDQWTDEFFKIYYHLWHHQGRRMRQGALMNGPDYAHWHGVFELQQDIRAMKKIYERRIKTGKID